MLGFNNHNIVYRSIPRNIVLVSAVMLLMYLCQSCANEDYNFFSVIHGRIVDEITGQPIENAHITLSPIIRSTVSDYNGQYSFDELDSGEYMIIVQKEGYYSNRQVANAISGESVVSDIFLKPIGY
ncbi:carboxypeptidase-like regulatory domain-containing protein [Barnesiella viscericola]|uniref:carboxypeptidase-like regulatory domain-containing protein n=1 Tax=Barnesiella viscericola TaxID=397865 RepID=UPI00320AE797